LIPRCYEIIRIAGLLAGGTLVGPEARQSIRGHLIRFQAYGFTVCPPLDPLCVERGRVRQRAARMPGGQSAVDCDRRLGPPTMAADYAK
jgi:hypothetical protein